MVRGSGIKRKETIAKGKPCIRYGEIYTSYNYKFASCKSFVPKELFDKCSKVRSGDIVLTLTGETEFEIAKALAYCGNEEIAAGSDLVIWANHQCDSLYLAYVMYSSYMIQAKALSATIGPIVHTSIDRLSRLLIPLPPLAEQKRIVAKIEGVRKLMQSFTI
ncbi:MAG: restriction endonuclease subunit S [Kiritimatiellae bacterium]|nr:restriction endonuclease subunit S [Kiritimatiellia bacterium]